MIFSTLKSPVRKFVNFFITSVSLWNQMSTSMRWTRPRPDTCLRKMLLEQLNWGQSNLCPKHLGWYHKIAQVSKIICRSGLSATPEGGLFSVPTSLYSYKSTLRAGLHADLTFYHDLLNILPNYHNRNLGLKIYTRLWMDCPKRELNKTIRFPGFP